MHCTRKNLIKIKKTAYIHSFIPNISGFWLKSCEDCSLSFIAKTRLLEMVFIIAGTGSVCTFEFFPADRDRLRKEHKEFKRAFCQI